ncbi:MAG: molybdate ABC transporter substrate-binding protein [Vicinamibacterales bacterium]
MSLSIHAQGPTDDSLRVVGTGAVQGVVEELAPLLAERAGIPLTLTFGTAGAVRDRIRAGEPADVVIATDVVIQQLVEDGLVDASPRSIVGRVGLGVARRDDGTASGREAVTPEGFTRMLLEARSIAFADPASGATAGTYLASLIERLGIAPRLRSKLVLGANGRDVAQRVARGEAEIGITFVSEFLPIAGIRVVAMLPESLQNYTTYAAAIANRSAHKRRAVAVLDHLAGPTTQNARRAAGFSPTPLP